MDLTFRYLLHFCQKTFPTYHCSFAQINFHKLIIWTNYPLLCAFLQYAGACPKIYFQKGSHAAVTQKDSLRVVRFPIKEFRVGQLFRRSHLSVLFLRMISLWIQLLMSFVSFLPFFDFCFWSLMEMKLGKYENVK